MLDQLTGILVAHGIAPVYQPVFHGYGWKGRRTAGNVVSAEDYARYCRYLVARYGARPAIWLNSSGSVPHVARRMADDPSIEDRLRKLVEQFGTARDLKTCIAVDIQFHHALIEASGLQPLVAFGDLLSVFFQRFREAIRKVEWKVGVENHRRLVDLLVAGRVDAAVAELREQIESNKERL